MSPHKETHTHYLHIHTYITGLKHTQTHILRLTHIVVVNLPRDRVQEQFNTVQWKQEGVHALIYRQMLH